jgi:hypothetical protein
MSDKFQEWLEAAKKLFLWVVAPIAFVAWYIYYLVTQNTELKGKLARSESDRKFDRISEEARKAEEVAREAETRYHDAVAEYRREQRESGGLRTDHSGSGQDDSGEERAD